MLDRERIAHEEMASPLRRAAGTRGRSYLAGALRSDGLFQVEGIFQVFEELGDDLIRQLIYELFGAFLESTHDSIISVGAGAGQLPGPPRLDKTPSIVYSIAVIYIDHNQTT
jgi:hypothetical protein